MNCDQVWDLLSVYADGETTPHEAEMVQGHIAVCASCATDLEFLQSTSVSLRAVPEVEPPVMLRQAILAATVNRPTWQDRLAAAARRTFAPAPLRYGGLAAAGAAAALTFVMIHEGGMQLANQVEYRPDQSAVATARAPQQTETAVSMPPAHPFASAPTRPIAGFAHVASHRSGSALATIHLARAAAPAGNGAAPKPRTDVTAMSNSSPAYKIKVENPADHNPDFVDAPPVVTPAPATANASREMETMVGAAPTAAETVATQKGSRIILASSTVDAGAVTTLATLKGTLKDQEGGRFSSSEMRQRMRDHQIRIDVIKGSF